MDAPDRRENVRLDEDLKQAKNFLHVVGLYHKDAQEYLKATTEAKAILEKTIQQAETPKNAGAVWDEI